MEGPSLVIITEEMASFVGKKVLDLSGNTKIEKERICHKKIQNILSWGKHLIIQFDTFSIRVHFLMYGSYRINEKRENMSPRLSLVFKDQEINFYNCSIKFIEEDLKKIYDWKIDIMSKKWDKNSVLEKVKFKQEDSVDDVLMNQDIFAGVGNIIKNEVLFNVKMHPESSMKNLKQERLKELISEARKYSLDFYKWKKEYTLKKHWQIFRKQICPRCDIKVERRKTGKLERWSYFCNSCQIKY